jgi:hypothetical protein
MPHLILMYMPSAATTWLDIDSRPVSAFAASDIYLKRGRCTDCKEVVCGQHGIKSGLHTCIVRLFEPTAKNVQQ